MNTQYIDGVISELENDLQTAKRFKAMLERRNGLPKTAPTERQKVVQTPLIKETQENRSVEYGATKQSVLKAIERCPEQYSINDIEKALKEDGVPIARSAISQVLTRMIKRNDISLFRQGVGRKPSIFKKG